MQSGETKEEAFFSSIVGATRFLVGSRPRFKATATWAGRRAEEDHQQSNGRLLAGSCNCRPKAFFNGPPQNNRIEPLMFLQPKPPPRQGTQRDLRTRARARLCPGRAGSPRTNNIVEAHTSKTDPTHAQSIGSAFELPDRSRYDRPRCLLVLSGIATSVLTAPPETLTAQAPVGLHSKAPTSQAPMAKAPSVVEDAPTDAPPQLLQRCSSREDNKKGLGG